MATEKKKSELEFRDIEAQDNQAYLTKSRHQLDLESRVNSGVESRIPATVNPNPHGNDDYVGTDLIYQNHSTDQNKPFSSEEGVEKQLESSYREAYESDENVVGDHSLGGKATKAPSPTAGRTYRTILPGQEGYDLQKAEEQNGPPLRVYHDEEQQTATASNEEESSGEEEESSEPPAPPAPPASPEDTSKAGAKSGEKK